MPLDPAGFGGPRCRAHTLYRLDDPPISALLLKLLQAGGFPCVQSCNPDQEVIPHAGRGEFTANSSLRGLSWVTGHIICLRLSINSMKCTVWA